MQIADFLNSERLFKDQLILIAFWPQIMLNNSHWSLHIIIGNSHKLFNLVKRWESASVTLRYQI